MALAGGSTPRLLHHRLVSGREGKRVPWERVRFFWGDERCVPPDDERSNYRMAKETLLAPLGIGEAQIFRMRGEGEPRRAASEYEDVLASELRAPRGRLDLVLLGLGSDGHTASLFPRTRALAQRDRRCLANYVPRLREWRLTLTFPPLNAARRVLFLVAGEEKRDAAGRILRREPGYRGLPAARVLPRRGSLVWLLDEAAGGNL